MKIREGFVSNSSSSSFVIIGNYLNIEDVTIDKIKNFKVYVLGDYLVDGQDIFQIKDEEELAFIKAVDRLGRFDLEFVESYYYDNSDSGKINLKELSKYGEADIMSGEVDYCRSDGIESMKDKYDEYNETEILMKQFLRSQKIKKIENED